MKIISRFKIMIPFIGFLIGYFVTYFMMQKDEVITPNIIGKSLQESVAILSNCNLSVKLLHEREDAVLKEGTVLDQLPKPNQKVKPNQNVFVTVSKKEKLLKAPNFLGLTQDEIATITKKQGIELNSYFVNSDMPAGRCIAQYPQVGDFLEKKSLIAYFSSNNINLFVMPSFKNLLLSDVVEFLKLEGISYEIIRENNNNNFEQVIDQRPIAGSIVNLEKNFRVQIQAF